MQSPSQASLRVSTDDSDFFGAELEAFVETSKRHRPAAWARVEELKRACRSESRAQGAALERSVRAVGKQTAA